MRRGNKAGLKLRRSEIDAAFQTSVKKPGEHFQIASLRACEIDNWSCCKEQTKQRTEPVKRDAELRIFDRCARELFKLRAPFFEQFPAVNSLKLTQLRQTGSERDRIARQRSGLIHRAIRRKLVHDFGAPAECPNRQSAADYLSQCSEIWLHAVNLLCAATRNTESSNHLVENQKRTVSRAFLSQGRQEVLSWKIKTGICGNRLNNYRGD